jgi:hypothetical protein
MAGCVVFEWVGGGLGIHVGRGLSPSTVAAAGGRQRDCWGSSTSVTWQPAPVRFGIQNARGREREMGGGTHLGCVQWVLVIVVGGDGGSGDDAWWWWWKRKLVT